MAGIFPRAARSDDTDAQSEHRPDAFLADDAEGRRRTRRNEGIYGHDSRGVPAARHRQFQSLCDGALISIFETGDEDDGEDNL